MDFLKNHYYQEDLAKISTQLNLDELLGKSFLITGATGMIGSCIVDYLCFLHDQGYSTQIYALGRSAKKIEERFGKRIHEEYFHVIEQNVEEKFSFEYDIDYMIHAASNSNPKLYAVEPVETFAGNVFGMKNVLEFAKDHSVKKVLYVSSGEMYGFAENDMENFNESFVGKLDYSSSRTCYPAGKRAAEILCQCYYDEYQVASSIVRPCHIYGPTMTNADTRAISSFIKDGIAERDIVMKSKGEQIRSHCYVIDAVSAIMKVLTQGENGEAYNIASDQSAYSIREMAEMICTYCHTSIVFDAPNELEKKGFTKIPLAVLDNTKLKSLGWKNEYCLRDGIERTIDILKK
ncbi:MAG: NAD(P)-dependent oxidoreductase [Erysipelotrichaceae bacterium]|nr:NAD(P)-dependent oxidoreductase [Erysipelotrichaceae bacterium]